jgi:hypothetical protein
VIRGDLIGGPLKTVFGNTIQDVELKTTKSFGLLSYTFYWTPHSTDNHVFKVQMAVNMLNEDA